MRFKRCVLVSMLLVAAGGGLHALPAEQGQSFDKLSDDDRTAFAARFKKEIWPLLQRDGKNGCVGCHAKTGGTLRFSGNPDKDFAKLLREGFFLKGDAGSLLERIADKDVKRRMPPKQPAWKGADIQLLRGFVDDVQAKQQH